VHVVVERMWGAGRIDIGRCDFTVSSSDRFSTGSPYVRWEHSINGYFEPNWGGERGRKSAIHWTDPQGRCRMLDHATGQRTRVQFAPPKFVTPFEFLDYLVFPSDPDFAEYKFGDDVAGYQARLNELVAADRSMLCDYCFFGGPDKTDLRAPIITRPEELM
jgi:hypothetical protein